MRHHDERPWPVVEELLEHAQRVEVEVVRRFVEEQDVRLRGEHQEELEASSFSAREQADRRPLRIGVEPERLEKGGISPVG